ncbi:pilus assembly protein TadG-related protein [Pseudomonas sp. 2FE]|uniref:pilus assembly protein TadG-related protein n=1 Tax=Pseudomonas sp. 2FE TaxID=2502190 RepID=UPI00273EA42C|nr:pilus assembly protein TadG-related protein [Pseudomonas sp. 2FE]
MLIVIALASMLLMGALALDGGHMLLNKTRLQNAVDAAALSGAKTLQQVLGTGNASTLSRDAALNTLSQNANASGNSELATAIGGNIAGFAVVELANSVYGPFSFPGPADASFVRVTVPTYPLTGFFWDFAQSFGNAALADKAVAAIATAGPPPCGVVPIMVCGDPTKHDPKNGNFWGYKFGDLVTLTCGTPGSPSAGNCQLLDLPGASGAADIREAFCNGIKQCVGGSVDTKPGMSWGPVAQGLNTRLGLYNGPVDATCQPDLYTDYSKPLVTMNGEPPTPMYQGNEVTSNSGDLSTDADDVLDIKDWQEASETCVNNPGTCTGKRERRVLNVVIGNCAAAGSGVTTLPVFGTGCFYLSQEVEQGAVKEVFGQFVEDCGGADQTTIQLYKTYIGNGVGVPSTDS